MGPRVEQNYYWQLFVGGYIIIRYCSRVPIYVYIFAYIQRVWTIYEGGEELKFTASLSRYIYYTLAFGGDCLGLIKPADGAKITRYIRAA